MFSFVLAKSHNDALNLSELCTTCCWSRFLETPCIPGSCSVYSCVCSSSTVSSRDVAKARQAARRTDTEMTVGEGADTVDEPPSASKIVERAEDVSLASDSITKLKREFLAGSAAEERCDVQTSVASTMTPFRCLSLTILA